jgi:hypothetical protein
VLSNLDGVLSDLLAHIERLSQAATTPTPTLPLSGGGCAHTAFNDSARSSPARHSQAAER